MTRAGGSPLDETIRAAVRRNLARTGAVPVPSVPEGSEAVASPAAWKRFDDPSPVSGARGGSGNTGGLHSDPDAAVAAALVAFGRFRELPLRQRGEIIAAARAALLTRVDDLARAAVEETGLGRIPHKIAKNRLVITKTPGPEILTVDATSGDDGLTLTEYAPFGVIAAITPVTNPSETVINNAISMLSGGNTVVFNAHPSARRVTAETIRIINAAARGAGSPVDPLHACSEPTIDTAQALMRHRDVRLVVVTGGPAVVKAALASGKKVIAAGAGNPPAVVDATADIADAARCIVAGASFDNNIICVAEKVAVAVARIAPQLIEAMAALGCHVLTPTELMRVEETIFAENRGPGRPAVINRQWIGKDAARILRAARVQTTGDPPLALALVPPEHPLVWTEQMLPVLPVVVAPDVREAIEMAVRFERGNRHTAMMHSRDVAMLSLMARRIDCSIFVKNGSCAAGLGAGGEGPTSFTIASPTGEGLTDARSFCRRRRCVLVGSFRIV
jgi:acyl-CoA reductase-like NAD-dependent aldehyde dehydrogenase